MGIPVVRRARRLGAAAVVIGLAIAVAGSASEPARASAPSAAPGRAAVLLLPWPQGAGADRALLARLGERRRALAVGLTSPTVGGYAPEQFLLDTSQGTRVPLGLYDGPPPELELEPGVSSGVAGVEGWEEAVRRARDVPAAIEPGLLAEAVRARGGRVAYAGVPGAPQAAAAVAADRSGRVGPVVMAEEDQLGDRLTSLWDRVDLLVARLPDGEGGLAVLDRVLRARAPGDLVYVVRAPPPAASRPPLLATGIAGPGFGPGAGIGSATTRRTGLVAATDVAPTVLERLGIPVPRVVGGRPIKGRTDFSGAPAAAGLHDRLLGIVRARPPALLALLATWLVVLGGLALARGRPGARAGLRLGLLAALWFPGLALATAALAAAVPPGAAAAVEPPLLAAGSIALAFLTDRLLPWPRGPALPAVVVLGAHSVDLALGSPLTATALTGPNPAGGARFFGLGNELETWLSVAVLVGVGAATSGTRARAGSVALSFAVAGLAAAAIMGSGRLGADVGAVITLGAGAAIAAACALRRSGGRRRTFALALGAPVVALGGLILLDGVTGADAHLSRSVLSAGPDGLLAAIERRAATQARLLGSAPGAAVALAGLAVLAAVAVRRDRLLVSLADAGAYPLLAGLTGALVAVVVGALANDSAPDMLAIGAVLVLLAAGYARAEPQTRQRRRPGGDLGPSTAKPTKAPLMLRVLALAGQHDDTPARQAGRRTERPPP